jgi:hypothetical protein
MAGLLALGLLGMIISCVCALLALGDMNDRFRVIVCLLGMAFGAALLFGAISQSPV